MSEKLKIEVEIDLANLKNYDEDGEPVPVSIEEAVVAEAGRVIVRQYATEMRKALGEAAREDLGRMVREALEPMVGEAIDAAIQPTSYYGEPKGDATTLREVIVKTATDELKSSRSRDGYGSRNENLIQALIREQVERTLKSELTKAIEEAKKQVVAAVQEKGAEVIADTITKLAGVR